jgi:hypothetical protein
MGTRTFLFWKGGNFMRKEILALILTIVWFSPVSVLAETTKIKKNFVSRSEFKGSNCCQISRVGGWTKYNARKRTPKKEVSASGDLSEVENKTKEAIN